MIVLDPTMDALSDRVTYVADERLAIVRELIDYGDESIASVLDDFRKAKVSFGFGTASLVSSGGGFSPTLLPSFHHSMDRNTNPARVPVLSSSGLSKQNLISSVFGGQEQFEWLLRSSNPPFNDLADVYAETGFPSQGLLGDSSAMELISRPPVIIDALASTVVERRAQITVRASRSIDRGQVWVSAIGYASGGGMRVRLPSDAIAWTEETDHARGNLTIPTVPSDRLLVICGYGPASVQRYWIVDAQRVQSDRVIVHSVFDKEFAGLRAQVLGINEGSSQGFELGLAWLLHLAGLSVEHLGTSKKLRDAPDAIAFAPNGDCFIVECTTGIIDGDGKLSKLAKRAANVKEELGRLGKPANRVLPVMVTTLRRGEVASAIRSAARLGIAVLTRERLESGIQRIQQGINPNSLFDEANREVARELDDGSFWH